MHRATYTNDANWTGVRYDLCVLFLSGGSSERPLHILKTLWKHPSLSGPWLKREDYPESTRTVKLGSAAAEQQRPLPHTLYGILTLPGNRTVGCDSSWLSGNGADVLVFGIPTGLLGTVFRFDYSWHIKTNPWVKLLDHTLVELADAVYKEIPFDGAVACEEAGSLFSSKNSLTSNRVGAFLTPRVEEQAEGGALLLSPKLYTQLNLTASYKTLPSGLRWLAQYAL